MSGETTQIVLFTLGVAGVSTLLILPPGVALAWWLARKQWPGKALVETLVALPLIMPPVATGFLLLRLLGRRGPLGSLLERLGFDVVFTWRAVVLAMAVMSFPLLVRSARIAFEGVDRSLEDAARDLGRAPGGSLPSSHCLSRPTESSLELCWPSRGGSVNLARPSWWLG